jgi:hypothetical protein
MIPLLTSVMDLDPVGSASLCQNSNRERHPGQLIWIQIWSRIRICNISTQCKDKTRYSRKYQYENYDTYNTAKKNKTT